MRRASLWIVATICAVALAARLYGIDWGLPQVYEEAYPFKKSWPMWGWGSDRGLDLNPHFFNYPSLFFYVQFLGQGLLYVLMRVAGEVNSLLDYRALYALDKTPFYVMARSLSTLFGVGTVAATFALGQRVAGRNAGVLAALLVALNHFHVQKSQYVEVDVPLTFFVTLTLYFAVRLAAAPTRRHYLLAGLFAGLATSTKYSGGLLPVSIAVAHLIAAVRAYRAWRGAAAGAEVAPVPGRGRGSRRGRERRGKPAADRAAPATGGPAAFWEATRTLWGRLLVAAAACGGALLLTSPYILLDPEAFWTGFTYEMMHMRIGHFGVDDTPAWLFYGRVIVGPLLGWPLAVLAGGGAVWLAWRRRAPWLAILWVYPLVYVGLISSWSMKADRYILPFLPTAAVTAAAAAAAAWTRWRPRQRLLATLAQVALATLLLAPSARAWWADRGRLRGDTRTVAQRWFEDNAPSGALIVSETYGPEPLNAIQLANLAPDVREVVEKRLGAAKLFGLLLLPMIQVRPEVMAPFYDLALYDDLADYVVTSSWVGSRYRKKPETFAPMLRFYEDLDTRYVEVRTFGPQDGAGPRLTVYRNPKPAAPFASRSDLPWPAELPRIREILPGTVGPYYQRLGAILEVFNFNLRAAQSYEIAATYPAVYPNFLRDVGLAAVRCYLKADRLEAARQAVEQALQRAPTAPERAFWEGLRARLRDAGAAPPPPSPSR